MCTKDNLIQASQAGGWAIGGLGIAFFIIGIVVAENESWGQAFGTRVRETGGGVVLVAMIHMAMSPFGNYGARNHNKFALCLHTGLLLFSVFLQLLLGGLMFEQTFSKYTPEIQKKCLERDFGIIYRAHSEETPQNLGEYPTECFSYISGDQISGFRMLWLQIHHDSFEDEVEKQDLSQLQKDGRCCGFGPPLGCKDDSASFAKFLPKAKDFMYEGNKLKCAPPIGDPQNPSNKGWYEATPYCNQVIDPNVDPPVLGGCPYEAPVGDCFNNVPDFDTRGCASHMQVVYEADVSSMATAIMALSCIPTILSFVSCCLFLKRKHYDVYPATHPDLVIKKKIVEEEPADGMLMLTIAEKPNEFIGAYNILIKEAEGRGETKREWKLEEVIKVSHQKKDNAVHHTWTHEVDQAYKRCLKVVDKVDTEYKLMHD